MRLLKNNKNVHVLLPNRMHKRLVEVARKTGCTKSWIVRAVFNAYIDSYAKPPIVKRPIEFLEPHSRFNICTYGEIHREWKMITHNFNLEFSPVIRYMLEMWYLGELEVDLDTEFTCKWNKCIESAWKKENINNLRYASAHHSKGLLYSKEEFWPKNPFVNLILMEMGLSNRIYPL